MSEDIGVVDAAGIVVEDCVLEPVADVGAVDDPDVKLVAPTDTAGAVVAVVGVAFVVDVCDNDVSVVEA